MDRGEIYKEFGSTQNDPVEAVTITSRMPYHLAGWLISMFIFASVLSCGTVQEKSNEEQGKGAGRMQVSKENDGTSTSAIDEVLDRNRKYAEQFTQGGLPGRPPRLKLAVLTCLDCRLHVSKLLGLEPGDAHIMRNAGGIVTEDVLRSLIVAYYIGGDREFMIINNTKCGMLTFKDEDLATQLERETGKTPVIPARFLAFSDLEKNVREQIRKVRSHPWIPENLRVRGFIYDVDTGRLTEVSP